MSKERKPVASRKSNVAIELEPVLNAARGVQLHASLAAVVESTSNVRLDGSKVERVETLALQTILSFMNTRSASGRSTEWSAVSTELRRASHILGLTESLRIPA